MKVAAIIFAILASFSVGNSTEVLQPGVSVEREIASNDVHLYSIQVTAGHYLRIAVRKQNLVLRIKLKAPEHTEILETFTPYSAQDPAKLSLIAPSTGQYHIELKLGKEELAAKPYSIVVEELRPANDIDNSRVVAERLFCEAETLRAAGKADDLNAAIPKYHSALELWKAIGDEREEAQIQLVLGSISHNISQPNEALEYYKQALALWLKLGDRGKEGFTHSAIGWTHYSVGNLHKALEHYNLALPIRRELGDLWGQAQTLTTIGQIYRSLGEPQKAMDHFSESLPLARGAGDKIQEAFALNNFAYLFLDLGEHQQALDYLELALPLWRETGNRYGEADALNSIGIAYDKMGAYERALDFYDRSLTLWRTIGNRLGEADALNNTGIVYTNLGQLEGSTELLNKGRDYLEQALALRRATGQRLGETDTLNNLGLVHQHLGDYEKAQEFFNEVLKLQVDPSALHNLGLNYLLRGDRDTALGHLNNALVVFKERGNRDGEAQSLRQIATIYSEMGRLEEALSVGAQALEIVESFRVKIRGPDNRTALQGVNRDFYFLMIDILIKKHTLDPSKGYDAAALAFSERARARGLVDLLSEANIDIREGIEPELLQLERDIQRQLNAKELYRLRLARNGSSTAEVERELKRLLTEYQELQAKIRGRSPKYATLTQPTTLTLDQIQAILDDDCILLEYALGQSKSFLWAVTPTSISTYVLPNQATIESVARSVYESVTARNTYLRNESARQRAIRIRKADAKYNEASAELSRILLGPVAKGLGRKRLLFVTEGWLQFVPIEALPVPAVHLSTARRLQALIFDHEVVILPSASVLSLLRQKTTEKSAPKSLAVIADPVFGVNDPRAGAIHVAANHIEGNALRVNFLERQEFPKDFLRLQFSREEADQILALVPSDSALKATGFSASKDRLKTANLNQYRLLHFATHGFLNTHKPELSGLVLSLIDEKGAPHDGYLRLHEIYNLKLNADLVVLSGCQTALGKEVKGEGLIGLTRGFMYAGSPRVVASLWNVDDRATAELMKWSYKGMLSDGLTPAAALKYAQVKLANDNRWTAPYYWAAFTIQGEWK